MKFKIYKNEYFVCGNFLIDNYLVVIVNKVYLNDIIKYKYFDGYKVLRF